MQTKTTTFSKLLDQPYPFYFKGKQLFNFVAVIFIMSVGFNYFFEPFDNYKPEHKMDFFWISVIHSVNAALVLLLLLWPIRQLVDEEKWTVKKEIVLVVSLFVMIGISQFLIRDLIYDNPHNWTWRYLFEEIRNTCLVGALFFSILIPINYIRLKSRSFQNDSLLAVKPDPSAIQKIRQSVDIQTRQKSDDFTLDTDKLLFAKAEGNYLEIMVLENDKIQKHLKRMTLRELEMQIQSIDIIRTHRSYLVNLRYVNDVKGNAQGYQLYLAHFADTIPVSRMMIPDFENRMKALSVIT
jgi:hypothetical protein